jgi:hypothetical protein
VVSSGGEQILQSGIPINGRSGGLTIQLGGIASGAIINGGLQLVYGTAIAKENGQVIFFDDIYGYDKAMGKLFAQAYASKN